MSLREKFMNLIFITVDTDFDEEFLQSTRLLACSSL